MNPLIIPRGTTIKGLFVFCNKCKAKNKKQLIPNGKCNHPIDKQVFKVYITIPNTKKVKTKALSTKEFDCAVREAIAFENDLKRTNYKRNEEKKIINTLPLDLEGCVSLYLDYLDNENVLEFQKKVRTEGHKDQVGLILNRFKKCMENNGFDPEFLSITDINNHHVGLFYDYLISKSLKNINFNRHLGVVCVFFNFLIETKHYPLTNYFTPKNVTRRRVNVKVDSISITEFNLFLEKITPENGVEILSTGEKKQHYFNWLRDAYEFALFTGRRRDEIVNAKFSDIYEDDGLPVYIETEDYKYNQRNNLIRKEEKKFIHTPIFKDLSDFLMKNGYEQHKGSDRYIIAPNNQRQRDTIKIDMTRSFTHFFKKLDIERNISFKHLRKTYITMLNNYTNGSAYLITGHSDSAIILKHYHNNKVIQDVLKNFRMIG